MGDKEERLTEDEVKGVLASLGEDYASAPAYVRGAVLVLASQDSGGFMGLGGIFSPLKHEVYSQARAILNDWILQRVLTPEQYAERQQALKKARGIADE